MPKSLAKWQNIVDKIVGEIKDEYLLSVKKAVVDFVLGNATIRKNKEQKCDVVSKERTEVGLIALKYRHKYRSGVTYIEITF